MGCFYVAYDCNSAIEFLRIVLHSLFHSFGTMPCLCCGLCTSWDEKWELMILGSVYLFDSSNSWFNVARCNILKPPQSSLRKSMIQRFAPSTSAATCAYICIVLSFLQFDSSTLQFISFPNHLKTSRLCLRIGVPFWGLVTPKPNSQSSHNSCWQRGHPQTSVRPISSPCI